MIKSADFIEQYKQGKVSAATLIKMAAFKDELEKALISDRAETLVKLAKFPFNRLGRFLVGTKMTAERLGKINVGGINIGTALVGGGLIGASMTLFTEALKAIEGQIIDWKDDLKKPKLFKEMMDLHPQLKEYDEMLVKKYYEALWHFSPIMAENPLAAGAYIRQAMSMHHVAGGPLPNSLNEVSSIHRNWSQSDQGDGNTFMTNVLNPFQNSVGIFNKDKNK